jgi:D-tyrosyl-tRNA(Tyr) deacylase
MKILIQRVSEASLSIDGQIYSYIGRGLLVLLGIGSEDSEEDIDWLIKKTLNLRVFDDENQVMNLSLKDIHGEILLVSQFTLHASTKKGNRPSYIKAAKPDISFPLYEKFIEKLKTECQNKIATGRFGADMKISLVNDGPVTIMIDSKQKE